MNKQSEKLAKAIAYEAKKKKEIFLYIHCSDYPIYIIR